MFIFLLPRKLICWNVLISIHKDFPCLSTVDNFFGDHSCSAKIKGGNVATPPVSWEPEVPNRENWQNVETVEGPASLAQQLENSIHSESIMHLMHILLIQNLILH